MAFSTLAALSLMAISSSATPISAPEEFSVAAALMKRDSGSCSGTFHQAATNTYGDFTGCTSQYSDGSGTYVRTDDVHRYSSGTKCWTDLFMITVEDIAYPWYPLVGSCVNCASTKDCSVSRSNETELCNGDSWSAEGGLDFKIEKSILEFGFSSGVSHEWSTEKCNTASVDVECKWEDENYHAVEIQDKYTRMHGYIRRRCNEGGDKTVWSKDWYIDTPTGDRVTRCDAWCTPDGAYHIPGDGTPEPSHHESHKPTHTSHHKHTSTHHHKHTSTPHHEHHSTKKHTSHHHKHTTTHHHEHKTTHHEHHTTTHHHHHSTKKHHDRTVETPSP